MIQQSLSIRHQLSAVIYITDIVTGRAVDHQRLSLILEPAGNAPIYKNEGCYIYSNLPVGVYRLTIRSPDYGIVTKQWEWNPEQKNPPVFRLLLQPSPAYSFGTQATRIDCRCVNASGQPMAGIPLTLYSRSAVNSRARLKKNASLESRVIEVTTAGVRPLAGEQFVFSAVDKDVTSREITSDELIMIECLPQLNDQVWQLTAPLSQSYLSGVLLLPVVQAITDHHGEAVLVIRAIPSTQGQFELVAGYANQKLYRSEMLTVQESEVVTFQLTIPPSFEEDGMAKH
ncbi:hypothetical protein [Paenibacillus nuruki]|uniref:hypothetical protein n=1 Tax=Paenibacillus nuruki TaxID=1886670 RepID=UPI002804EB0A|nr:hypothetical protein [Paenibacillus nuruki]CAJ1317738.1 hypothetical protein AASFL403_21220 [Paenibacillus nuruki]